MDIVLKWSEIRKHFNKSFSSSLHVSIASVDEHHNPTVTPIGSLFLNRDQTGFYFEKFPTKLPVHSMSNNHVCILAVNSNRWFWLKSLFRGRFHSYPAIKLYGKLGINRIATPGEIERLQKRMKGMKGLKGYSYLWSDMDRVREISFHKAEGINLGKMTELL